MEKITVEYLLQQESFLQYCLKSNPVSVKYWEDFLVQYPAEAALVREAVSMVRDGAWLLEAEKARPSAIDSMRTALGQPEFELEEKQVTRSIGWRRIAAAAAVIGLVSLLFVWLMKGKKTPATVAQVHPSVIMQPGQQRYNIPARKMVNLSDGSFILLDSGATISIDPSFGGNERLVHLTGTAWFKVAKDQQRPFRVITGNIRTTVLGTAFRVNAPAGGRSVKVELEEGKVSVERTGKKGVELLATLMPTESITVSQQETVKAEKTNFAVSGLQAWKAEEIIFDDAPLSDVISQLEILYDQPILLEDVQLAKATFTGRFRNDSLNSVLDMLCFSLNKKYRLTTDNKILIY